LIEFYPNWNVPKISVKMPNMKTNENPFISSLVACRQTDTVKLKSAFLQLLIVNAPKRINT
jgi:hypothetical protein